MKPINRLFLFLLFISASYAISYAQENQSFFLHTIEKGQSLYSISKMYNVTTSDIIRLNPGCDEKIYAGQTIKIPKGKDTQKGETFHTIQAGETLYKLTTMYNVSAKAICEAIGSITQDRSSGIGGVVGKQPASIPMFVTVNDSSRGQANSMRMRLIDDEQLVPSMVDAAVVNTVSKTVDRNGGGTAKLHFTITGVDSKKEMLTIDRENMYYSNDALLKNLDAELTEAVTILMQNKFEPVQIYGINVEAEVSNAVQVAEILNVRTKNAKVKPGDKVAIDVTMKPYRGEEFTKTVYFKVPKDHPGGKLALNVRGGSSMAWAIELLRKQQSEGVPAAKKKETRHKLSDYIKSVNTADKNNELIIDVAMGQMQPPNPEAAANDAGLAGMLQGSPFKQKYPFDFIIDGESEIVLTVDK